MGYSHYLILWFVLLQVRAKAVHNMLIFVDPNVLFLGTENVLHIPSFVNIILGVILVFFVERECTESLELV